MAEGLWVENRIGKDESEQMMKIIQVSGIMPPLLAYGWRHSRSCLPDYTVDGVKIDK